MAKLGVYHYLTDLWFFYCGDDRRYIGALQVHLDKHDLNFTPLELIAKLEDPEFVAQVPEFGPASAARVLALLSNE